MPLEFAKTRPTGRDLFGTPDLELGIHNSKIKANRRQESARKLTILAEIARTSIFIYP